MKVKLSQFAKDQNVTYRTAWQWFKDGKIKTTERNCTGRIYVILENEIKQKSSLNNQKVKYRNG